jgi:SAM-dependent methyltransferase
MQWNMFRETQLDSKSGHQISAERFWASTEWTPASLEGQWVLDCGCGAGRFAEVALSAGARVVALDYSSAADAAYANLKHHPNLHVVQADIYSLPFAPATFPFVYSLGVLQHTPDVEKAFAALPPMVARGGKLCADFYEATWKHRLLPRHYLRPVTTRIDKTRLFDLCKKWVPRLLSVSQRLGRMPGIGRLLVRAMPVADYTGLYPLDPQQLREWALLDTFDWLSPAYDQPQRRETVARWIEAGGFTRVDVVKAGFMIVRGIGKR